MEEFTETLMSDKIMVPSPPPTFYLIQISHQLPVLMRLWNALLNSNLTKHQPCHHLGHYRSQKFQISAKWTMQSSATKCAPLSSRVSFWLAQFLTLFTARPLLQLEFTVWLAGQLPKPSHLFALRQPHVDWLHWKIKTFSTMQHYISISRFVSIFFHEILFDHMQSLLSTWLQTIFYTQMSTWHEECSRHDSA